MVQTIFFIDYSWREEKASRGCVILYTFRRKVVDNLLARMVWGTYAVKIEVQMSKDTANYQHVFF